MKKLLALLVALAVALGLTVFVAAPAFAVEMNACHPAGVGINHPVTVQRAVDQGGEIRLLYPTQCTSHFGWGDAQRFQVTSGKKVKLLYPGSTTSYRAFTVPGWYRFGDWCISNPCYLSVHNN
jgi:hypothetical protein